MSESNPRPPPSGSALDTGKLAEPWASAFPNFSGIASAAVGGVLILW